jgi:hypothetical protein
MVSDYTSCFNEQPGIFFLIFDGGVSCGKAFDSMKNQFHPSKRP